MEAEIETLKREYVASCEQHESERNSVAARLDIILSEEQKLQNDLAHSKRETAVKGAALASLQETLASMEKNAEGPKGIINMSYKRPDIGTRQMEVLTYWYGRHSGPECLPVSLMVGMCNESLFNSKELKRVLILYRLARLEQLNVA